GRHGANADVRVSGRSGASVEVGLAQLVVVGATRVAVVGIAVLRAAGVGGTALDGRTVDADQARLARLDREALVGVIAEALVVAGNGAGEALVADGVAAEVGVGAVLCEWVTLVFAKRQDAVVEADAARLGKALGLAVVGDRHVTELQASPHSGRTGGLG